MLLRLVPALMLFGGAAAIAQPAPEAALLAGGCQGCHGAAGEGRHGIPSIRQAQTRAEFIATMQAFRTDQRPNTVMGRITRGYTEAEIAVLAAHFGKPQ
jgi:sulfide dehydrogenase cytochrome subunit